MYTQIYEEKKNENNEIKLNLDTILTKPIKYNKGVQKGCSLLLTLTYI
jgi:hypothetical protein